MTASGLRASVSAGLDARSPGAAVTVATSLPFASAEDRARVSGVLGLPARERSPVAAGHDVLLVSLADDRAGINDVGQQHVQVLPVRPCQVRADLRSLAEKLMAVQTELHDQRLSPA